MFDEFGCVILKRRENAGTGVLAGEAEQKSAVKIKLCEAHDCETTCYSCECGASYESITAPLGHNFKTEVIMPTVKDMGYTSYSCNCGFSYNGNYRFYSEILDMKFYF